jgi:hypothetical protein
MSYFITTDSDNIEPELKGLSYEFSKNYLLSLDVLSAVFLQFKWSNICTSDYH